MQRRADPMSMTLKSTKADPKECPTLVDVISQVQSSCPCGSRAHLSLAQVVDADLLGLQEVEGVLPLALGDVAEQEVLRTSAAVSTPVVGLDAARPDQCMLCMCSRRQQLHMQVTAMLR